MAHKSLFRQALDTQRRALVELRSSVQQAAQRAAQIRSQEHYTSEFKEAQVQRIGAMASQEIDGFLRMARETQERLEAELSKRLSPEVPLDVRAYNATRAGVALAGAKSAKEIAEIYESEAVQRDTALRQELERAVELHAFGKTPEWRDTVSYCRPREIRTAEAWRQKLDSFTGEAELTAREHVSRAFRGDVDAAGADSVLSAWDREAEALLSEVE